MIILLDLLYLNQLKNTNKHCMIESLHSFRAIYLKKWLHDSLQAPKYIMQLNYADKQLRGGSKSVKDAGSGN